MKVKLSVLFFASLLGISAVVSNASPQGKPTTPPDPKLASAVNDFGVNLLKEILKSSPKENVLISPFSLSAALTMTHFGAAKETLSAMRKALQLSALQEQRIGKRFQNANLWLTGRSALARIDLANSIWIRMQYELLSSFTEQNERVFGASARNLDFSDPHSVEVINGWVSGKTHKMIPTVIDEKTIDPNVMVILVNSLYFHGKWATPFDKTRTSAGMFQLESGQKKIVKMMRLSGEELRLHHLNSELFEAVALPYGKDELRMAVLLPRAKRTVNEVLSAFNAESWASWAQGFEKKEGMVSMPRFKLGYKKDNLVKELSSLGMAIAFDDRADFSRMSADGENLFISTVLHKTEIEVDEEGTKAAAASRVDMSKGGMEISEAFQFIVDRPFVIVIYEPKSKMILFLGKIVDPPAA